MLKDVVACLVRNISDALTLMTGSTVTSVSNLVDGCALLHEISALILFEGLSPKCMHLLDF